MRNSRLIVFIACLYSVIISCSSTKMDNVIEVVARDFNFVVADSIPSGWSTFRFNNTGHAEHFFLLNLLPDSISYDTYHKNVTKPFEMVFDSLKAGKSKEDAIGLLINLIPGWYFSDVKQMGGTGIVSMGKSTDITLNLPAGTYAMECYIKEQGVFHTALGMIRPIVVTEKVSGTKPPLTNVKLTLSNYTIATEGSFNKGLNSVAVHFEEHPEIGLGNDVHIIKLTDQTDMDEVIDWLDWMNIKGLQSPAPVIFYGGSQEMPVGNTSYFTTTLEPGEYALIAESSASKGMVKRFTIK